MLTQEKEAELKTLLADQPDLLTDLLSRVEKTDKAAQAVGVAYKESETPAWAQTLIARIDALEATTKAMAPASMEQAAETEMTDAEDEQIDDGEPDGDEGMDDTAFAQLIAQAVVQAITPLLDIEKKMAGHMADLKSTLGGYTSQKDDTVAKLTERLEKNEAALKEVAKGEFPRSVFADHVMSGASGIFRPSEAINTLLPRNDALKVKEQMQQVPADLNNPTEIDAYRLIFGNQ